MSRRILEFLRPDNQKPDVEFVTRLPLEECKARLLHSISSPWSISSKPVKGVVTGNRFYIYRKGYYRDSGNPTLSGELAPFPGGTHVRASFDSTVFGTILVAVVLGFITCNIVRMIASNPGAFLDFVELNASVIPYIVLISIGAALAVGYSIREHRLSKAYLINQIRTTLSATSIATAKLMQVETSTENTITNS